MIRTDTPEYRKAYKRGWTYSGKPTANLDTADRRRWTDSDAWLDGYLDYAAGRSMWHLMTCPDHETCDQR